MISIEQLLFAVVFCVTTVDYCLALFTFFTCKFRTGKVNHTKLFVCNWMLQMAHYIKTQTNKHWLHFSTLHVTVTAAGIRPGNCLWFSTLDLLVPCNHTADSQQSSATMATLSERQLHLRTVLCAWNTIAMLKWLLDKKKIFWGIINIQRGDRSDQSCMETEGTRRAVAWGDNGRAFLQEAEASGKLTVRSVSVTMRSGDITQEEIVGGQGKDLLLKCASTMFYETH